MKESISFLLGAGFSVPFGYLTAEDINEKFLTLDTSSIDFIPSGQLVKKCVPDEWISTNLYSMRYRFCLKLIEYYSMNKGFFDYEKFFDFITDTNRLKSEECRRLADDIVTEYTSYDILIDGLDDICNQLIRYILSDDELMRKDNSQPYFSFLSYLQKTCKDRIVNIHTLNHDLLFKHFNETVLNRTLSDGFGSEGSKFCINGTPGCLEYYQDKYDTNLRLYKLHGSFNYVVVRAEHEKSAVCVKIPPKTSPAAIVDKGNLPNNTYALSPYFLTGCSCKTDRYNDLLYFRKTFEHFENNLKDAEKLIIIGYGCKDKGINDLLKKYCKHKLVYILDPKADKNEGVVSLSKTINAKIFAKGIEDFNETMFM